MWLSLLGERNFHIFYSLAKGATKEEKKQLGLGSGPQYFSYLSCSKTYDADGINDVEEYTVMKNAMNVCKISEPDQQQVLSIVAGILHLGNLEFDEEGNQA